MVNPSSNFQEMIESYILTTKEINKDNIDRIKKELNEKNLKIRTFAFSNINKYQDLKNYSNDLASRASQIKQETAGTLAYFCHLFSGRRRERAVKLEQAKQMEELSEFIMGLGSLFETIKNIKFIKHFQAQPAQQETAIIAPLEQEVVQQAVVHQEEQPKMDQPEPMISVIPPESLVKEVTPVKTEILPIETVKEAQTEIENSDAPPPAPPIDEEIPLAPPPDDAPPAPPLDDHSTAPLLESSSIATPTVIVKPKLSEEQLYFQREQRKRENQLKDRANPKELYKEIYPTNKSQLEDRQSHLESAIQSLEEDIRGLEQDLVDLQEQISSSKTIETVIKRKKQALQSKQGKLESQQQALKQNKIELQPTLIATDIHDSIFHERMKKLTNEELQILMGILFFDEKEQRPKAPESSHPKHYNYTSNQTRYDPIFETWSTLSAGKSGQAFLQHQEAWKKYLDKNILGVTEILRKRIQFQNQPRHIDHLNAPNYDIPPYDPKAKSKSIPAIAKNKPSGERTAISLDALTSVKLKKMDPSSTQKPPTATATTTHEKLMESIRQGKSLKKTMS